jgi:hypothetical protein
MIGQKNLELVISSSTTPSAAGKISPPGPLSEKKTDEATHEKKQKGNKKILHGDKTDEEKHEKKTNETCRSCTGIKQMEEQLKRKKNETRRSCRGIRSNTWRLKKCV